MFGKTNNPKGINQWTTIGGKFKKAASEATSKLTAKVKEKAPGVKKSVSDAGSTLASKVKSKLPGAVNSATKAKNNVVAGAKNIGEDIRHTGVKVGVGASRLKAKMTKSKVDDVTAAVGGAAKVGASAVRRSVNKTVNTGTAKAKNAVVDHKGTVAKVGSTVKTAHSKAVGATTDAIESGVNKVKSSSLANSLRTTKKLVRSEMASTRSAASDSVSRLKSKFKRPTSRKMAD